MKKLLIKLRTRSYNFNNKYFLMYNCNNLIKLLYKTFRYIFITFILIKETLYDHIDSLRVIYLNKF